MRVMVQERPGEGWVEVDEDWIVMRAETIEEEREAERQREAAEMFERARAASVGHGRRMKVGIGRWRMKL